MNKLELGCVVHYVMPDLTCRAAIVTKVMGFAVNVVVLAESAEEQQGPFMHMHPSMHYQYKPVVVQMGVSPSKKPPEYVPAAKALEDRHNAAEKARYETQMADAHTDDEKKAVPPPAKYTQPSPEALAQAEEMQEWDHEKAVKVAYSTTYHMPDEHDAMTAQLHDVEMRKANRELEKVKAKHAATMKSFKDNEAEMAHSHTDKDKATKGRP